MSSFDEYDLDALDDQDLRRLHHGVSEPLDDDELAERDAQALWALEVQSQVALMNHRNNR